VFIDQKDEIVAGAKQPHIVEYGSEGTELVRFETEGEAAEGGIAFGFSLARLYLVDASAVHLMAVPPSGPLVAAEEVKEAKPVSAVIGALIDGEGSKTTTYDVEYGETSAYGAKTSGKTLATEQGLFANYLASVEIQGLHPSTTYHYRFVAEDEHGHVTSGPDATIMTLPPAGIENEFATNVTTESAKLGVELNPFGSTTEYHFEYGLDTSYGTSAPVPDASAGAGSQVGVESVIVEHLAPGTTYHYRVIAHNGFGTVQGPDRTFTTAATAAAFTLADNRAWEMVSPPQKNGASLEAISEEGALIQASDSGDALTYVSRGPVSAETSGSRSALDTQLLSRRSGAGWSTTDITTSHEQPAGFDPGERAEYLFFSNDLSTGLIEPAGATPLSPAATERTPYLRESTGQFIPLVTASNVPSGTKFGGTELKPEHFGGGVTLVGASADARTVAISSPLALTPGFSVHEFPGKEPLDLYEWQNGSLQLVSWLPSPEAGGAEVPSGELGVQALLGSREGVSRHAVSKDGSRYIFTTVAPESGEGHLVLRDTRIGKSVLLDREKVGEEAVGGLPQYGDASGDAQTVFFVDEARLTPEATAEPGRRDLYECEIKQVAGGLECARKDLTVSTNPGEPGDVLGQIIGTDETGDRVYFVANGALVPNAVHGDCVNSISEEELPSENRMCNLYMYDGRTGETRLVAVLSGQDHPDWALGATGNLGELTARVSPDGRYLAFMSDRSLTNYDNRDAHSGERDEEVFLYDSATSKLTCVSCDPTGARPKGVFESGEYPGPLVDRPRVWAGRWLAATIPGWTRTTLFVANYQSRYLLNDGRVFFNATDALVPEDASGQFEVYEYEPGRAGTCGQESGCVALMSAGQSGTETAFLDASSEGDDVFFLTSARLSGQDGDNALDVYDAHVCKASSPCPAGTSSSVGGCEEAAACRNATPPEATAVAAAPVVLGNGNVSPTLTKGVQRHLTRAQELAKALKACKRAHGKHRRACEARARRKYGSKSARVRRHRRKK
jgi:hypothetical protein